MDGVTGLWLARGTSALGGSLSPIQTTGPSAILDAPAPVRALAAFAIVSVLGGLLLWRYAPFVDRAIESSMARPLSSLAYGVAAHAVIAFGGVYLTNQLAQITMQGQSVGAIGVLVGLLLVLLAAALGFTVVGSTVVSAVWGEQRWYGLVVGACIAGVAGFLGSTAGGLLWFVVVSMGIGGPARRWLHADEIAKARDAHRE